VSGGFDSSAVACVAKALVDRGAISQSVRLYSMVYPETPAADESAYFDAIARHCNGFPAVHVISNGYWGLRDMGPEDVFPLDEPDLYPTRGHLLSFFRRAADDDCRVLLLGEGGDHVLSRNLYLRLDAVRGLPWRHLLPEFAHALWWGRHAYSTGGYLARLAYSYVTRQLPEPVMGRLRHLRKSLRRRPPWLLSDGSSQQKPCALDERFFCPSGLDPAGQAVHRSIRRPYEITRHSPLDVVAAFAMIEPRSPFWDRRLVDFMLGVPRHLRGWRGVDRLIAREALRGVLPEEVRQRVRKGDISPIVHLGLREKERLQVESLLRGSCAEKLGFINALALYNDIYLPYVAGATDDYQPWLRAIYLEVWLRKRHLAMANDLKGAP